MERELWPRLYRRAMEVSQRYRIAGVSYQPHIIALVMLWAALHDRPMSWACRPANWSTTALRPARIPSAATVSRRLRRVDTAMFIRQIVEHARQEQGPAPIVSAVDAKPLPVGGDSGDPEARCGRGAGMFAKGYKLYLLLGLGPRPVPDSYRVYPMNAHEGTVSIEMMAEARGGGYLLGDGLYDGRRFYDAAASSGYQLVAPREDPGEDPGRRQSPHRLRSIAIQATPFGRDLFRLRGDIERYFGSLTCFGGGLAPLPAWVRHCNRVWLWVTAKILINAERVFRNQRLTA